MPLTPILRRTFAIFRERPLLFMLPPMVLGLATLINWPSAAADASIVELAAVISLFLYATIGTPIEYALLMTLTLQAEEGSPISISHAWERVRHQPHLVGTVFVIEALFAATVIAISVMWTIFSKVLPALNILLPASGTTAYNLIAYPIGALLVALLARIFLPLALAIPIVLIKRPLAIAEFHAIEESRRLSRGIFWSLAAIVVVSMVPDWVIYGAGHFIHLPPSTAIRAVFASRIVSLLIDSVTTALLCIAITLIAIDRIAADSLQETSPSTTPNPQSVSQVVIL